MQVYKFGGASVKDAAGVKNLANIIQLEPKRELLIVVSAMGKTTNKLEELTWAFIKGEDHTHQLFEEIKAYHFDIIHNLFEDPKNPVYNEVSNAFVEIEWLLDEEASD
ncbi:MAG: aspartate kinase, partial [Pedobacter sp.]|nr:aspartate kinase [Pedobacter sp.]